MTRTYVITAAGANGTAIRVLDRPLSRSEYEAAGKKLGLEMESVGAEQTGFLMPNQNHFEMSGGEFCGNAARSTAILLSKIHREQQVTFTMSGYEGVVSAKVQELNQSVYFVECTFPHLPIKSSVVALSDGQQATVVDLKGIVHVVIESSFPDDPRIYQTAHRRIVEELRLNERSAVGVVWFDRSGKSVRIHPVVWVKAVNTFFYERSCGSGTIAVGKVTGVNSIVQPSGKSIELDITPDTVTLKSDMEIVYESA